MTTYTIENESNNLIGHLSEQDADVVTGAERFSSEEELATLAASWPTARLIAIFNNLPGVTPVKKFTDRKTAIARIWNAVQPVDPPTGTIAEPAAGEAPKTEEAQQPETAVEPEADTGRRTHGYARSHTDARRCGRGSGVAQEDHPREEDAHSGQRFARGQQDGYRPGTHEARGGVTAKELMSVTGWQAHSVRGFISGTLGKKMGLTVVSTKGENGERTYTIQG